ncbi:hypothetical protein [Methylobacterium ajmalii]|uniref:hypothetical protein n=1 Tax=Methylobacterium ajmalii TaxID=2738439 RepID=UPI002F35FFC4
MQLSFRPDDRQKALRWLTHGVELAVGLKGARTTHRDVLWRLLGDAIEIMERVPDQERSWLSSGTRSGGWGAAAGLTRVELLEIERLRVLSSMMPFDGPSRCLPQRDDIERAVGVMTWLRWCSEGDDHRLQKAAIALARGSEDAAARIYRPGGRMRQVTYEIRSQFSGRVLKGLARDAGIVPARDGLHFEEVQRVHEPV